MIWGRNTRNNRFVVQHFAMLSFLLIWKELFPYLHIKPIHFITDKETQISSAVMKSKTALVHATRILLQKVSYSLLCGHGSHGQAQILNKG